jgi:hypothetical protein
MRDALREKARTGGTLKEALASLDGKEKTKNSYYSYAAAAASGATLTSGANAEPLDLLRRLKVVEEELFALHPSLVEMTDPRRDNQHPSPSASSTVTVPSHIIQPMRRASGAATGGRGKPPPKPPTC